jgi:alpha-L-fucosidase 2
MENKNRLVLKTPAGWYGDPWHEALPVGNGNVGAGVYGAVKDDSTGSVEIVIWKD